MLKTTKEKAVRLPSIDHVIAAIKSVDLDRNDSPRLVELERKYEDLEKKLSADIGLRALDRSIRTLRDKERDEYNARADARRKLIHRVRIEGVTPKVLADVKKFLGYDK